MYVAVDWFHPRVNFVSPGSAEHIPFTFIYAAATLSQVTRLRDDKDDGFI